MKVKEKTQDFIPITIEITIETYAEAERLKRMLLKEAK